MSSLDQFIKSVIANDDTDRPIFIFNTEDFYEKVLNWKKCLPRVDAHYAMKSNDSEPLLQEFSKLNIGFDCASVQELKQAFQAGVTKDRIVFANPCKTIAMLKYAKEVNVDLMTFDCTGEVDKIREVFPEARLLLRLKVDDSHSKYKLGNKFGATYAEALELLEYASNLQMKIVGIAFHVGSDCTSAESFEVAIRLSSEMVPEFDKHGFVLEFLDIGGGFPGNIDFSDDNNIFYQMAKVINENLDKYFSKVMYPNLKIISEPGRYFSTSAFWLVTKIVGKRTIYQNGNPEVMYYLNDGLFGTFLIKFWEPQMIHLIPILDEEELSKRKTFKSTVWGPTCDSSDFIMKDVEMKEMEVGEFFVTKKWGAYTVPLTTPFNKMEKPVYRVYYKESIDVNGQADQN